MNKKKNEEKLIENLRCEWSMRGGRCARTIQMHWPIAFHCKNESREHQKCHWLVVAVIFEWIAYGFDIDRMSNHWMSTVGPASSECAYACVYVYMCKCVCVSLVQIIETENTLKNTRKEMKQFSIDAAQTTSNDETGTTQVVYCPLGWDRGP